MWIESERGMSRQKVVTELRRLLLVSSRGVETSEGRKGREPG